MHVVGKATTLGFSLISCAACAKVPPTYRSGCVYELRDGQWLGGPTAPRSGR